MKKLKVAMLAPNWLKVPAAGYGGTESFIENLCRGLDELGVKVEFFGVKGSQVAAKRHHGLYDDEHYEHIAKPMYDAMAIPLAHILSSIDIIRRDGRFDIIHDNNWLLGPAVMGDQADLPPVLHTLHGPFSNPQRISEGNINTHPFYSQLGRQKVLFNGISQSQISEAPASFQNRIVGVVHHGIDPAERKFYKEKGDYFINVGRVAPEKGISIAAKACVELGEKFKIAGIIAGLGNPRQVAQELQSPTNLSRHADFQYYRDQVLPYTRPGQIEYVGSVFGETKDEMIGRAKAFLMPIQWEEPFGIAIIDALVCGTPVIAMRRGSMPEIIEHGVNGFLADTPKEFTHYMSRVDEIDPRACRQSVEQKFSYQAMAKQYLKLYEKLTTNAAPEPSAVPLPARGLAAPELSFFERAPLAVSKKKYRYKDI